MLDNWGPIFVVYFSPSDYPGMYVVRRQRVLFSNIDSSTTLHIDQVPLAVNTDYEQVIRRIIPFGMVKLDRRPGDDSCILETWI